MRLGRGVALAVLSASCGPAIAHSPIKGIGSFYGGMLHVLAVPAHWVAVVAMGLWLGQTWPRGMPAAIGFLVATPVGMAAALLVAWPPGEQAALMLGAATGLAVAAALRPPVAVQSGLGVLLGLVIGADSLPDGLSGRPLWMSLAGTWLALLLGIAWVVAVAEMAVRPWMKIAQRVVASWLAAAALLVLALTWLGPRPSPASAALLPSADTSR